MTKKITFAIVAASLTGAIAFTAVQAHPGKGQRAERMFERMDTDKDGIVTTADVKAAAATRFAAMDKDGDGVVNRAERREARQQRRANRKAARFARLDTDGDGTVTLAEVQAAASKRAERRFARLDADGDGLVSLQDMQDAKGKRGHRSESHRGKRGDRAGKRGPMTLEKMETRMLKRFERIDADGDGQITLDDVKAAKPFYRRG